MSKVQIISVISFLSYCIIIGTLVFSRGFLLNRQIIPDKAGPCLDTSFQNPYHHEDDHLHFEEDRPRREILGNLSEAASWCNQSPVFKRAILILVDALRYDFVRRMSFLSSVIEQNQNNEPQRGKLSQQQQPQHSKVGSGGGGTANYGGNTKKRSKVSSCLFRFIADPPTTTMQRLKALMTGTMPTFIDASANFNSYEVEEDSLIYQLNATGKKLAFLGDDTWLSLFPPSYFTSPFVEAHPSFNAWDLDTVDRAVNHTLRNKIFPSGSSRHEDQWDVLFTHLLGVDHCGHRYGPAHPEMTRKLNEADAIIEFVFNSMSDDTLLVIFGDHGMTHTGDHGGDSRAETDSAVVFVTKARRGMGTVTASPPYYQAFQCPSYSQGISQIDLVPTLATLLGVPIPFSSIGQLIPNFIPDRKELYTDAVSANAAQVDKYITQFGIGLKGEDLRKDFLLLQEAFHSFQLSRTNASARARVNTLAHRYLTQVKHFALSTWTQFNVPMIYTGVVIAALAASSLMIYLMNSSTLLLVSTQYSVLAWLWPSLPLWSVLSTFIKFGSGGASSGNLLSIIISTFGGLIMFLILLAWKLLQNLGRSPRKYGGDSGGEELRDAGSFLLYAATCLAMFSNSFVINEGYVLGSALLLVVFLHIVFSPSSSSSKNPTSKRVLPEETGGVTKEESSLVHTYLLCKRVKCSLVCFLILAALVRTCSIFFRCREELTQCTEEYLLHKQLASLPEEWLVHKYVRYSIGLVSLAIFVVAFRLWMLYQKCLFSKRPAAIVAKFIPSLLVVLLGVFWALQGLPLINTSATKLLRPILNYFPWVFQASTFVSLVLVWLKPLFTSSGGNQFQAGQPFMFPASTVTVCGHCAFLSAKKMRAKAVIKMTSPTPQQQQPQAHQGLLKNGITKKINGLASAGKLTSNGTTKFDSPRLSYLPSTNKSVFVDMEHGQSYHDPIPPDDYSNSLLLFSTLVIVLMTQITSVGIAPAVAIIIPYMIVSLVGIFRNSPDSWCCAVAWTLCSQYLFYGTGHQPIFSAIPWDSAFLSLTDGQQFTEATSSWLTWVRPALAILLNLHVSQIVFSLALPLLAYWSNTGSSPVFMCQHQLQDRMHGQSCHSRRKRAYVLSGKFILLHGLKLLACMACAGWHRRHLMVWKIFAPKFIFEAISFIVVTFTVIFSLVFVTRIDYLYHRDRHKRTPNAATN